MNVLGFEINTDSLEKTAEIRDAISFVMQNQRISLDAAERLIGMLIDGKIGVEQVYAYSFAQDGLKKETQENLFQRLDSWQERFGTFTAEEMDYLHSLPSTSEYTCKPKDILGIVDYVSKRVIGQDFAIKKIVSAVWLHCESVRKNLNIKVPSHLLIGDTGVGKTQILNTISEILQCPIIRINASTTVAPGYKGGDSITDQIFSQLSMLQEENPNIANGPIVVIVNEVDKVVRGKDDGYCVELMSSIMALIEKSRLFKSNPLGGVPQFIDLNKCLVLFDGCFSGIEKITARNLNMSRRIGFSTNDNCMPLEELRKRVSVTDLVDYGLMHEMVGRIGDIICLNNMTIETLYKILDQSLDSPVKAYVSAYEKYGHKLQFSKEAMLSIAKTAFNQKLGARTLENIVCAVMQPYIQLLKTSQPQSIVITEHEVARILGGNNINSK